MERLDKRGLTVAYQDATAPNDLNELSALTHITNTTTSTNTTTGALKINGGVGVLENNIIGGPLNITGNSTLSSDLMLLVILF